MTNSLTVRLSRHFGSLQFSGLMLIALLQRTPVLRMLAAAESVWVSSSLGQVLKASAAVATLLGAVDTLAGATSLVATPASPAEATVGESFSAVFAYTGGPTSPESYSIAGLPPGLVVPGSTTGTGGIRVLGNATSGSITGTPTQEGTFNVTITAFDGPNLTAGTHGSAASVYTIIVEAGSTTVAPAITAQPASVTVTAGQPVSFSVEATGTAPLTYQWRKGGVNINGATSATYTIPSAADTDAGSYTVVVTNAVNSATSNGATLTVNPAPAAPLITTQPESQVVIAGDSVTFTAAASGNPAPTYQWRKNGVNLAGATASSLTISGVTNGDAANYTVVATNASGSATSNIAQLLVIIPPSNAVITFTVE